jgi:hypothetical protein
MGGAADEHLTLHVLGEVVEIPQIIGRAADEHQTLHVFGGVVVITENHRQGSR